MTSAQQKFVQALLSRLHAQDPHDAPATYRIEPVARPRYREIEKCRLCGNPDLVPIVSLGEQHLTGVFARGLHAAPSKGPLELLACSAANGYEACGLVQLCQSYDPAELFGANYGYRSSLQASMVAHLQGKVEQLLSRYPLQTGDLVLDIGSNDGTLLSFYPAENITAVGIDPVGAKFASHYQPQIKLIPDFFSADLFRKEFGERKAQIVTSICMLHDLEDPLGFMREVTSLLADEGVWHFETAYLPAIVRTMGYDSICHEQLEYYSLRQIKWMTDRSDLKILGVEFNETNGGSLAVTVARRASSHEENLAQLEEVLRAEEAHCLTNVDQQQAFAAAVEKHKTELLWLLHALKSEHHFVLGYGASTNGNVLLQHCGIARNVLPAIAEVNKEKLGCCTPGTSIPIISEAEAHALRPDYFLVLPWQFRDDIIRREAGFLARGGKLIFPLPEVEIVG